MAVEYMLCKTNPIPILLLWNISNAQGTLYLGYICFMIHLEKKNTYKNQMFFFLLTFKY